jgi:hypothetical protein
MNILRKRIGFALSLTLVACSAAPSSPEDTSSTSQADSIELPPIEIGGSDFWAGVWARAESVKGFSYKWGGDQWDSAGVTASNAGKCITSDPNGCPNCTHQGDWGADCSGFLQKAWGVPEGNIDTKLHNYNYNAPAFAVDRAGTWSTVPIEYSIPGDALVNTSHVMLLSDGDPTTNDWTTIECVGCAWGCKAVVHHAPANASKWHVIRRADPT